MFWRFEQMVVASYLGAYDKDENKYNARGVEAQVRRLALEKNAHVRGALEVGQELQRVNDEIRHARQALQALVQKQENLQLTRHRHGLQVQRIHEKADVLQDIFHVINGDEAAIERIKKLKERWAALGKDPHEIGFKLGGRMALQRELDDRRRRQLEQGYMRVRVPPGQGDQQAIPPPFERHNGEPIPPPPPGAPPRLERQFGQLADAVYRDLGVGGHGQRLQQELYQAPTVHVMFT